MYDVLHWLYKTLSRLRKLLWDSFFFMSGVGIHGKLNERWAWKRGESFLFIVNVFDTVWIWGGNLWILHLGPPLVVAMARSWFSVPRRPVMAWVISRETTLPTEGKAVFNLTFTLTLTRTHTRTFNNMYRKNDFETLPSLFLYPSAFILIVTVLWFKGYVWFDTMHNELERQWYVSLKNVQIFIYIIYQLLIKVTQ